MTRYSIIYSGKLSDSVDKINKQDLIKQIVDKLNIDTHIAERLVNSTDDVILKNGLDISTAEAYQQALEEVGLSTDIKPDQHEPQMDLTDRDDKYANQTAAPSVSHSDTMVDDLTIIPSVSPDRAWNWVIHGWSYFRQNPGLWIGSIGIFLASLIMVGMLPNIGWVATYVLAPILSAGLMMIAHKQHMQRDPKVVDLFSGFSTNTNQLTLLGFLYMVGNLLIFTTIYWTIGDDQVVAEALKAFQLKDPDALDQFFNENPQILKNALFTLLLFIPLNMFYWFAPAMIILDNKPALVAIKLSFLTCLRNIPAFLFYVIAIALFSISTLLVTMLFIIVLSSITVKMNSLVAIALFLTAGIIMAVLNASTYASYRDLFH